MHNLEINFMTTIYILSYNNLSSEFWADKLGLSEADRILFFREGKTLFAHLNKTPDAVIIDDYFSENSGKEYQLKDLEIGLRIKTPHIKTYFFSPTYVGKVRVNRGCQHYYSNMNNWYLELINNDLKKLKKQIKAA